LVAAARARAVQGARLPRELAEAHYMFATPVDMPRLGRHVVYIEWRHDRRDGPISGQRVWAFDARDDGIVMRFFTLKPAAKAVLDGLIAPDPKTAALGPDDLNGYPPPCHIVLKRSGDVFEGANAPPGGCVFPRTTVTGGTMRADAFIRFALELHREKVDMVQTGPGEALSDHAAETEDWIYLRVK
ncbi:MAG: CpcT/CpeT family chromophore lyase, partial [Rhodospirillaceae bacterium]|nr:CpcT/CpeT family chromophore lyase [Rhodospirillaceae bacterium]